jgi:RimJ/RimL family protein N-acetyltransferase
VYEGGLVRLRELRPEDAEKLTAWRNDPDTADRMNGGSMPWALEEKRDWILSHGGRRDDGCVFAVETLDGTLVGTCTYRHLDWKNRTCLAGWFIGDPAMRGRGYGTDLIETLLRVLFQVLGLHKVSIEAFEFNEAARLYERLGFQMEGVFRKEAFVRGRWWDVRRYGMLESEWAARQTGEQFREVQPDV